MVAGITACNDPDNIGVQTEDAVEVPSKTQQPPVETGLVLPWHLEMSLEIRHTDTDQLATGSNPVSGASDNALLERIQRVRGGDLDEIRQRRFLRVLVTYSRTNFFFDRGARRVMSMNSWRRTRNS